MNDRACTTDIPILICWYWLTEKQIISILLKKWDFIVRDKYYRTLELKSRLASVDSPTFDMLIFTHVFTRRVREVSNRMGRFSAKLQHIRSRSHCKVTFVTSVVRD